MRRLQHPWGLKKHSKRRKGIGDNTDSIYFSKLKFVIFGSISSSDNTVEFKRCMDLQSYYRWPENDENTECKAITPQCSEAQVSNLIF